MDSPSRFTTLLISLLLLFSTQIVSQETIEEQGEIGKIFTAEEADKLFGEVDQSVKVEVEKVASFINQLQDYVMFDIQKGRLVAADKKRNPLQKLSYEIPADEKMHVYSVSKVIELLEKGKAEAKSNTISFEKRGGKMTITYGSHTLELASVCPPICF